MTGGAARLRRHPAFAEAKRAVAEITGMVFYEDKDETLAAILGKRLAELGLADLGDYLARLRDPEEREHLISEVTIGETYFLRHLAQWRALEDAVIPDLIRRNGARRRLRLWSAGCSAGAEPYTLAILLRDRFAEALAGWEVSVLGTDLNRRSLAAARAGRYGEWYFRTTPDELRARWFERRGQAWEIRPEIRAMVGFQSHNLVSDPIPPGRAEPFDLILCRNVMIYFDAATNARLVEALGRALDEGGWLVVGHAEASIRAFDAFETVMLPETTLYRKGAAPPTPAAPRPPSRPPARPPSRRPVRPAVSGPPARPPVPVPRRSPPASPASASPAPASPQAGPAARPAAPPAAGGVPSDEAVRALIARGDWDAAGAACAGRLRADPLDAAGHVLHGLLLEQRGDAAAAEDALRRALFLDRGAALAHHQLGCLLRRRGDAAGAARAFRNVLDLLAGAEEDAPVAGGGDTTAGALRAAAALQLGGMGER